MKSELKTVLEEMRFHLENGIIPFWINNANDSQYGGYLTCFDGNGKRTENCHKFIVTQTRMIWGLSALYHMFPSNKALLDGAVQGTDFFIEHFWDKTCGGWFWKVNREGAVIDSGKVVYGQSFAIYALAEYYKTTGDSRGLEFAEKTFDLLMKYALDSERGGFYENMENDWHLSQPGFYGGDRKSLDIHLHLLEAFTNLYDASKKEIHKRRLIEVINIILNKMVDHENECGGNQFDLNFQPIPAININRTWNAERTTGQKLTMPVNTTSYGHNLELVWLLDKAASVIGYEKGHFNDIMKGLTDHCLKYGIDYEYGGVYRDGPVNGPALIKDKEWWQHCEAFVGLLYAYRSLHEERYIDGFFNIWNFAKKYFINEKVGEWRQLLTRNGKVIDGSIGNPWKAIYHTGRSMMESIRSLEDILKE